MRAFVFVLLAAACGDDPGKQDAAVGSDLSMSGPDLTMTTDLAGPRCMLPACGGDLVGTWSYASECPAPASVCTVANPSYTSMVTFNADRTFDIVQTCDGDHESACNCSSTSAPGHASGTYTYQGCSVVLKLASGLVTLGVHTMDNSLILTYGPNESRSTTFLRQ